MTLSMLSVTETILSPIPSIVSRSDVIQSGPQSLLSTLDTVLGLSPRCLSATERMLSALHTSFFATETMLSVAERTAGAAATAVKNNKRRTLIEPGRPLYPPPRRPTPRRLSTGIDFCGDSSEDVIRNQLLYPTFLMKMIIVFI